jgi:sorbitol-specific phosphotransferase system component IIBC
MEKQPPTDSKKAKKHLHLTIIKQMLTLTTSGFGLVAALAWNSVIQEFVNTRIKPFVPGGGFTSLLVYAILITIIAVTITYQLSKLTEKFKE